MRLPGVVVLGLFSLNAMAALAPALTELDRCVEGVHAIRNQAVRRLPLAIMAMDSKYWAMLREVDHLSQSAELVRRTPPSEHYEDLVGNSVVACQTFALQLESYSKSFVRMFYWSLGFFVFSGTYLLLILIRARLRRPSIDLHF